MKMILYIPLFEKFTVDIICLHAFPTSKHDGVYETVCQMALFRMLCFYLNFFPRLICIYLSANSYSNVDYYYA